MLIFVKAFSDLLKPAAVRPAAVDEAAGVPPQAGRQTPRLQKIAIRVIGAPDDLVGGIAPVGSAPGKCLENM